MIGFTYEPEPSRISQIKVTSSSSTLPVTVAEVRTYMRLGSDSEDAIIEDMIRAATRHIERYIDKTIVERDYEASFDCIGDYTELPFGPVISVDSVSIDSESSTAVTNYHLVNDNLYIKEFASLSEGWNYGVLKVAYKAGEYKDDASGNLDDDLKQVIIEMTAKIFERGEAAAGLPKEIKDKLDLISERRYFK